jgi:hypothetical protein
MFVGEFIDCRVDVGGQELRTREHPSAQYQPGQKVVVELPPEACAVLREDFEAAAEGANGEEAAPAAAAS